MTNIISIMISSMLQTDPYIAYLFFAMIIAGVAVTYFYRKEIGFIFTIIISLLLGYINIFSPFIYILSAVCFLMLFLSILGGGSMIRPIKNLEGWIYLKRISKKGK